MVSPSLVVPCLSVCHSANVIDGRDSSVIVSWLSTPRAKKLLGHTNYRDFRRLGLAGLASRWPKLRGLRVFRSSSTESTATFQARSPDFHPSSSPEPSLSRIQPSLQPASSAASATVNHSLSGEATIMHRWYCRWPARQTTCPQQLPFSHEVETLYTTKGSIVLPDGVRVTALYTRSVRSTIGSFTRS
jgi:hypothetical protein